MKLKSGSIYSQYVSDPNQILQSIRNNTIHRNKSKDQERDLYEENLLLKKALQGTKVFLNMVIHDLKNPASQISFTID